ncbi:hypothetical protein B0H16DRAFT_1800031 [Mycena metata]|uniref:Uncharacterized protein n=1 Tax=Mycena metata TaxID=1033252 RepID=A0AAD7HCM0_9AGAR|nr:hypothetical protein B0H16DRAFT_1800031 [Mycena metata]
MAEAANVSEGWWAGECAETGESSEQVELGWLAGWLAGMWRTGGTAARSDTSPLYAVLGSKVSHIIVKKTTLVYHLKQGESERLHIVAEDREIGCGSIQDLIGKRSPGKYSSSITCQGQEGETGIVKRRSTPLAASSEVQRAQILSSRFQVVGVDERDRRAPDGKIARREVAREGKSQCLMLHRLLPLVWVEQYGGLRKDVLILFFLLLLNGIQFAFLRLCFAGLQQVVVVEETSSSPIA